MPLSPIQHIHANSHSTYEPTHAHMHTHKRTLTHMDLRIRVNIITSILMYVKKRHPLRHKNVHVSV